MARPKFVNTISAWLSIPLLVQATSVWPLDDFGSVISALPSNIQTETIDAAFYNDALCLPYKMPSLVPPFVFLVLDYSLPMLAGCSGNIESFTRVVVYNDGTVLYYAIIIRRLESKHLVLSNGIELPKSEYFMQIGCLVPFHISFNPKIFLRAQIIRRHNRVQLIFILLAKTQSNFAVLFIKNECRYAINELVLVLPVSDLLHHKQLSDILDIRLHGYNTGLFKLGRIVFLDPKCFVSCLADDNVVAPSQQQSSIHNRDLLILYKQKYRK